MVGLACYVDDGAQRAYILHPTPTRAGGWRVTHWDRLGPTGHEEYPDRATAAEELRGDIGPWPAVPGFGLEARPSSYRLATTEPAWLGLTVISGGVVDPLGAPPPQTTEGG